MSAGQQRLGVPEVWPLVRQRQPTSPVIRIIPFDLQSDQQCFTVHTSSVHNIFKLHCGILYLVTSFLDFFSPLGLNFITINCAIYQRNTFILFLSNVDC